MAGDNFLPDDELAPARRSRTPNRRLRTPPCPPPGPARHTRVAQFPMAPFVNPRFNMAEEPGCGCMYDPSMTSIESVAAIIPARGGSKGIPRKNVLPLCGHPVLAYTISDAFTAGIPHVFVSTDDLEIANVATAYGAGVIRRPPPLSADSSTSESAILHALDTLNHNHDIQPSVVAFMQATSPIRQPEDLPQALDRFRDERADSLFTACRIHGFVWKSEPDKPQSVTYDFRSRTFRQQGPLHFEENGSFYLFSPELIRATNNRLGGTIALHEMHSLDSFQLDEPGDIPLFETLIPLRRRTHPSRRSTTYPDPSQAIAR